MGAGGGGGLELVNLFSKNPNLKKKDFFFCFGGGGGGARGRDFFWGGGGGGRRSGVWGAWEARVSEFFLLSIHI